ncbi:unnamed protein product [Brassica napus]|uniref:(rape) hypothetical protein n=1 Tax=Brassica napus TaxID=3708 RepID=A0A816STY2_BRANA|nr:unnamed protein product [Brassica napus]
MEEQVELLKRKLRQIYQGETFNGKPTKTARSHGKKFQVTVQQEIARLLVYNDPITTCDQLMFVLFSAWWTDHLTWNKYTRGTWDGHICNKPSTYQQKRFTEKHKWWSQTLTNLATSRCVLSNKAGLRKEDRFLTMFSSLGFWVRMIVKQGNELMSS